MSTSCTCVYMCVRESERGGGGIGLLSIIYTVGWMNFFSKWVSFIAHHLVFLTFCMLIKIIVGDWSFCCCFGFFSLLISFHMFYEARWCQGAVCLTGAEALRAMEQCAARWREAEAVTYFSLLERISKPWTIGRKQRERGREREIFTDKITEM